MHGLDGQRSSEGMKDRLRALLAAGAGTLVVATAVVMTEPASASIPPARAVVERVEAVRASLVLENLSRDPGTETRPQLVWHSWSNWENYQYQDQVWANVPNWHNVGYRDPEWHNWQNWHDWGNRSGGWNNRY